MENVAGESPVWLVKVRKWSGGGKVAQSMGFRGSWRPCSVWAIAVAEQRQTMTLDPVGQAVARSNQRDEMSFLKPSD